MTVLDWHVQSYTAMCRSVISIIMIRTFALCFIFWHLNEQNVYFANWITWLASMQNRFFCNEQHTGFCLWYSAHVFCQQGDLSPPHWSGSIRYWNEDFYRVSAGFNKLNLRPRLLRPLFKIYFRSNFNESRHHVSPHTTLQPWMYNINWIQCCWWAPAHSYESCSVAHEAKNGRLHQRLFFRLFVNVLYVNGKKVFLGCIASPEGRKL